MKGQEDLSHSWNTRMGSLRRALGISEEDERRKVKPDPYGGLFKIPLPERLRQIWIEEQKMLAEAAMKTLAGQEVSMPSVEEEGPKDKKKKRKRKQSVAKTPPKKAKEERPEKETPLASEPESLASSKIDDLSTYGRKSIYSTWTVKPPTSPEGSEVHVEVFHIVPVTLTPEEQRALKCELCVNVFLNQPWTIIRKSDAKKLIKSVENCSLQDHFDAIKAYPEEEMLIGRCSFVNPDEFVIALTTHGRSTLLEEIKARHLDFINKVIKLKNFPTGTWKSLGSEKEVEEGHVVCSRPFISYDCTLKRQTHENRYEKSFDYEEFYVEITGPIYSAVKTVEGSVFDKQTQVGPVYQDVLVETTPEIPVNSTTQYTTEMRVIENEEKLQLMELDEDVLKQKMTSFLYKVDSLLTYNEEYDLYQDDYEILANAGEELNMYPSVPYEHFLTMVTFIGTKGRGIATTSWHPNTPGVIAVSYAKESIKKIGNLSDNSDDDDFSESDTDDEKFYESVPTSTPFENVLRKLWICQLKDLDEKLSQGRDRNLYKLASTSLKFIKYARDMRLFEMIQAKKQLNDTPDVEDLNSEENFVYPLFTGTKRKYRKKKIDIDEILQREPKFLKRNYLFSDTFQWKLQAAKMVDPIYLMIKENKEVPKKYIKTFLFKELWAGDEWNFGADLETMAIDINQKFRESGLIVFGKPQIPRHKIFLPGFNDEEFSDTEKVNPWKELEEFEQKLRKDEVLGEEEEEIRRQEDIIKEKSAKREDKPGEYKEEEEVKSEEGDEDDQFESLDQFRRMQERLKSLELNQQHLLIQKLPKCQINKVNIYFKNSQSSDKLDKQEKELSSHDVEDKKDIKSNKIISQGYLSRIKHEKNSNFEHSTNLREEKKIYNDKTIPKPAVGKSESVEVTHPDVSTIDIPHITNYFNRNTSWGFTDEAQTSLKGLVKELATGERKQILQQDLEVLSSDSSSEQFFEKDDDEEELDKLELQHYVVIWSIIDDLKPMHRLISPFEVTSISFCPYVGLCIVGGLITGQVVVWELEGYSPQRIEEINIEKNNDSDGFRHLRKVMSWFKRLNSTIRIPVSGLSCKKTSHMNQVIDITWLPPNIEVLPDKGGRYQLTKSGGTGTLQFMSTSADGIVKYWSLKSIPKPPLKAPFSVSSLQRKSNFEKPEALKLKPLKYNDLYLRWDPIFQVKMPIPDPPFSASRFHITCVSHDEIPYEYQRQGKKPQKGERRQAMGGEYNMSCLCNINLLSEAIIGTIDGMVAYVSWQQPAEGQPGDHKMVEHDGLPASVICTYHNIHDGPISHIARHPSKKNLFLTAGGHVFALWSMEMVEPLKWKKYPQLMTTFVGWTGFKASTFRVGFSDGTIEVWDLLEDGTQAKMKLAVAEGSVYNITVPRLPIPRGIIAVTDQRGVLKFFKEPMDYQVDDPEQKDTFFNMIETEKSRKIWMKSLADEWWKEKEKLKQGKGKEAVVKVGDEESIESGEKPVEQKDSEKKKLKEIVGCKKFKEELYKWYLRRRGRTAAWLDPAERLWYSQEEEHMINTILKNRKISMKELDIAIRPLEQKEKRESELDVKIEEIVNMADEIFQSAIREFEIPRQYIYKSQVSLELENMAEDNIKPALEKVQSYFGESYEAEENELKELVKLSKIKREWTFPEILEKYQEVRDFWNDRRRYLDEDQKWLREIVKEEIEKEGLEFSYWINHEESYLLKKYRRRLENIQKLRNIYGHDYDPFWDLKEAREPMRLHDRFITEHYSEEESKGMNMQTKLQPGQKVDINLPEGSFYRKYMENENLKWKKPKKGEEIFSVPFFKFKYGETYPHPSDEELEEPPEEKRESVKELFPWSVTAEEEEEPTYEEEEKSDIFKTDPETGDEQTAKGTKTKEVEHKKKKKRDGRKRNVVTPSEQEEVSELKVVESKEKEVFSEAKASSSVRFEDKQQHAEKELKEQILGKINFDKEKLCRASFKLLRNAVIEKKAKGENIPDIDEIQVYDSCSSVSSLSSLEGSPQTSIGSEDEGDEMVFLEDTEETFKEYFEGLPPRYEPPKRRPYLYAPHEDEMTEEWLSEERPEDSSAIKSHQSDNQNITDEKK